MKIFPKLYLQGFKELDFYSVSLGSPKDSDVIRNQKGFERFVVRLLDELDKKRGSGDLTERLEPDFSEWKIRRHPYDKRMNVVKRMIQLYNNAYFNGESPR